MDYNIELLSHLAIKLSKLEREVARLRERVKINENDILCLDTRTQPLETIKEALKDGSGE